MKVLNGTRIQGDCKDCAIRKTSFFCNLSAAAVRSFDAIRIASIYPKGARLFIEGQPPDGVFLLCGGRAKLTTHSRDGKALILGIAIPGDVLGLSAAISDYLHEATAEAIEPCHVNFLKTSDFRRFLEQNADAGVKALQQLSYQYNKAYIQIRSLGLSTCVADKLAKLLIEWSKDAPCSNGSVHLKMSFSHEEIAEMIGTSRETVTRLLKDFRERGLISIKGSDLHICDKHKLEITIGNGKNPKPAG